MCESEKKEQTQSDQPKDFENDEFLEALRKDGDEGLREAFGCLNKDGKDTARVEGDHLKRAVSSRDPKISVENAKEIIQHVNQEGLLTCDEFVKIVNLILTVKKDDEDVFKKAFEVMSKDGTPVRFEDVQLTILIRDPKISVENTKEIVQHVNREGLLSCDEFVKIVNLILTMKKDDGDVFKKAFDVMSKDGTPVRFRDVQLAICIRDSKISVDNVEEIVQHVNQEGLLNCDEFVKIVNLILTVKKDDVDVFKKAFDVMSKDGTTVRFEDVQLAICIRDPKILVENAREIVQHVNREGLLSCEEFVKIVNLILTVKKDDKDVLNKAFDIMSKDGTPVRLKDVQLAILCLNPKLLKGKAVPDVGDFNRQNFVEIFKLLEEPDRDEAARTMEIYNKLKDAEAKHEIILTGERGVGKTWTAREVATRAVRKGDFDAAIWVYLNRNYAQDLSLQKSIAYQLSVLGDFEEFVANDAKKKAEAEEVKKNEKAEAGEARKNESPDGRGDEIPKKGDTEVEKRRKELEDLIKKALKGKRVLFVHDGDGEDRMKAEIKTEMRKKHEQKEKQKSGDEEKKEEGSDEVKSKDQQGEKSGTDEGEKKVDTEKKKEEDEEEEVYLMELKLGEKVIVKLELGSLESYNVLTTTSRKQGELGKNEITVKPFSWSNATSFATRALQREENRKELEELAHYFVFMSQRLPSQLLLIRRIVAYFGGKKDFGLQKLKSHREMIKKGQGSNMFDVLIQGYEEMLPKSVLIDCYSPERPDGHFMYQERPVSFNELIFYWIMEGHFGHFGHPGHVDKMYMKGHRVLMELMNCGLLQKQEGDYVVPTGTTEFNLRIHDYKDFFSEPRPGLGVTFDMSLGRVALGDGRIVTIGRKSDNGKEQIISTLLLDGNLISEEERTTETLSKYKDRVEVLAISNPTSQHFKLPILEMKELRLLALRGCQFLDKLEDFLVKKPDQETDQSVLDKKVDVKKPDQSPQEPAPPTPISEQLQKFADLEKLTVLEISGRCEAETIPDFFKLMPNLKTVNLSHLNKVKSLPRSFYDLKHIEFLILRGCSSLKELSSLKNFKELKVLDVSDATSFEKFEDKSLQTNDKLQILNLSNTNVKTLPLINQLNKLKFVWLRGCQVLPRIRKIDRMRSLKIFDIAGAQDVERFCDPSLEDLRNSLLIVDISGTKIRQLPADIGDPTYLYAKGCLKLKVVPPVEGMTKLEVLDLSGCTRLKELRKEFFDKLKDVITELNLSNTRVESLPFLSSLTSLRRLQLSECKSLGKAENLRLSCLEKMETLDLSGCEMVMELEEGSFDKMINLKILNLSRTGIKALPSLSKLQSLEELYVRDCPNLNELPGVEKALNLKVLDYSGTVLQSPPSFKNQDGSQVSPTEKRAHPKVVGEGIESMNTTKLFKDLGIQSNNEKDEWQRCKKEHVRDCKWIISNSRVEDKEEKLGTPVYGAHFFQLLDMPQSLRSFLTDNSSKFCFLVYPSEAEDKIKARFPDKNSYGVEVSLREIYMGQVCREKMERSLELREFNELPKTLRPLLDEAEFIVLVDDKFLKSLPGLGVEGTMPKKMKACWIERCDKLEYVVAAPEEVKKPEEEAKSEEEQRKEAAMVKGEGDKGKENSAVEKAGESATSEGDKPKDGETGKVGGGEEQKNAGHEQSGGDPETKNEGDESKNGGAADTSGGSGTVEDDQHKSSAAEDNAGGEGDQQKGAAAEEKTAETAMNEGGEKKEETTEEHPQNEIDLPKDAAPKIEGDQEKNTNTTEERPVDSAKNEGDQPKNDNEGEAAIIKGGEEVKNAAEDLKNLQRLWISDVPMMQNICKGDVKSVSFIFLKSLYLEFCPKLSAICASSSQLPNLETLFIKYCKKLKSLFEFEDQNPSKLENLKYLQLWGLDSLQKINCDTPSLNKLRVGECPNLEYLISSRLTDQHHRHEAEGHQNLEILHIKSCDNLKGIFEQEGVVFEKLTELELSGLPEMKDVAMSAPNLGTLRVEDCPSLECIITGAAGNLQILDVRCCEKMKRIVGRGGARLVNATEIKLLGLPELKYVGPKLPEVKMCQERTIRACPKLEGL